MTMLQAENPTAATAAPAAGASASRLESIDVLRGLVMVVMALDHVRDYFHWGVAHGFDPLDLATTTPVLFFTRFVTHFCAPTFMLLAGTGAAMFGARGRTPGELSRFLLARGAWLILLELTYFHWAWDFNFDLAHNWGLVIWALGWSMIVLAGLIHLPRWAPLVFGLVLIAGHNALDGIKPEAWGGWAWLWHVLHVQGTFKVGAGGSFWVMYPLVPWVGVMAAGYALGAVFQQPAEVRRRWLWRLGLGALAAFAVVRGLNVYGNLTPWTPQPQAGFTVLSFLDVTKYPPSLCYLLVTLGGALIALALLDRGTPRWLQPFLVFGRVPFFYYLLHIPLIHALSVLAGRIWGREGFSLAIVYLVWAGVVVALYPLCRWFAGVKRRHRSVWLSYL